jgi:hypothetical protein
MQLLVMNKLQETLNIWDRTEPWQDQYRVTIDYSPVRLRVNTASIVKCEDIIVSHDSVHLRVSYFNEVKIQ